MNILTKLFTCKYIVVFVLVKFIILRIVFSSIKLSSNKDWSHREFGFSKKKKNESHGKTSRLIQILFLFNNVNNNIQIDTFTIHFFLYNFFFFLFNRSNHPSSNSISLHNEIDTIPRYRLASINFHAYFYLQDKNTGVSYQKQTYRQQAWFICRRLADTYSMHGVESLKHYGS